ncbi:MAG TPA: hypothetical protein RMG45_27550, partial [Polyangiaceae bacterium LLY-WYZ-15_(1-7)]|nr:hypothetical protein [Polyangiaceae bacterium LLY-WYZ-15_(1-7)]
MYRCELCNAVQAPRTPAVKVVVETRPAEYPSRPKAHKMRIGRKLKSFDDPGGAGYEIAREAFACPRCAEEFLAKQAEAEAAGLF